MWTLTGLHHILSDLLALFQSREGGPGVDYAKHICLSPPKTFRRPCWSHTNIMYAATVGNLFVLIIHLVMNASSFCVNAIVEVAPYSSWHVPHTCLQTEAVFFYCLKRALNCALAAAGVGGVENISIQGPTNWTVNCVIIYFIYILYLLVLSYVSNDKNIDWLCNCNWASKLKFGISS